MDIPVDAGKHAGLARGCVNLPITCFVFHFVYTFAASKPAGPKRLSIDIDYLASRLPNVLANPVVVETSGKDPTAEQ
jgi:hypothetical protein